MYCKNCKKEIEDNSSFCSYCGASQEVKRSVDMSDNPLNAHFSTVFNSNYFRLATLFYLVYAVASAISTLASGETPLPIADIFILISLFRIKKLAFQNAPVNLYAPSFKIARIVITVLNVLIWIAAVAFAVCGILLTFSGALAGVGIAELIEELLNETNISLFGTSLSVLGGIFITVIGIIFIVISIITMLVNIFVIGTFKNVALSAEQTAQTGVYSLRKLEACQKCFLVLGVLKGISALSLISNLSATTLFDLVATIFYIAALIYFSRCAYDLKKE